MNKSLPFILMLVLIFSACEKKKERLTNNTFSISIDPATSIALLSNTTTYLKAVCRNASNDNVDVNPVWRVDSNLGTFSPGSGKTTIFTAGNATGNGNIYASYDTAVAQVSVNVTSSGSGGGSSYVLYTDQFASDLNSPGVFNDNSVTSPLVLSSDNVNRSEGLKAFRADFTVTAGGWCGWYAAAASIKDMSAYSAGFVRFNIMTAYDIQIGIRSNNTSSNSNSAKRYISSYITPNGSIFQSVSIPISDFAAGEQSLDLLQMKDMFIATAIGLQTGAQSNKTFIIDNIRWTTQ